MTMRTSKCAPLFSLTRTKCPARSSGLDTVRDRRRGPAPEAREIPAYCYSWRRKPEERIVHLSRCKS